MTNPHSTIAQMFLAAIALNGSVAQAADVFPSRPLRIIVAAAAKIQPE